MSRQPEVRTHRTRTRRGRRPWSMSEGELVMELIRAHRRQREYVEWLTVKFQDWLDGKLDWESEVERGR